MHGVSTACKSNYCGSRIFFSNPKLTNQRLENVILTTESPSGTPAEMLSKSA